MYVSSPWNGAVELYLKRVIFQNYTYVGIVDFDVSNQSQDNCIKVSLLFSEDATNIKRYKLWKPHVHLSLQC